MGQGNPDFTFVKVKKHELLHGHASWTAFYELMNRAPFWKPSMIRVTLSAAITAKAICKFNSFNYLNKIKYESWLINFKVSDADDFTVQFITLGW